MSTLMEQAGLLFTQMYATPETVGDLNNPKLQLKNENILSVSNVNFHGHFEVFLRDFKVWNMLIYGILVLLDYILTIS